MGLAEHLTPFEFATADTPTSDAVVVAAVQLAIASAPLSDPERVLSMIEWMVGAQEPDNGTESVRLFLDAIEATKPDQCEED